MLITGKWKTYRTETITRETDTNGLTKQWNDPTKYFAARREYQILITDAGVFRHRLVDHGDGFTDHKTSRRATDAEVSAARAA